MSNATATLSGSPAGFPPRTGKDSNHAGAVLARGHIPAAGRRHAQLQRSAGASASLRRGKHESCNTSGHAQIESERAIGATELCGFRICPRHRFSDTCVAKRMSFHNHSLNNLVRRHAIQVSAIEAAVAKSKEKQCEVQTALSELLDSLPVDLDLVICGSLARGEFTNGSDIDWTLMIDGAVDSNHLLIAKEVERRFREAGFQKPGPAGPFGNVAFSHDLVHLIGGDTDTNANTTRRILLLLESCSVGHTLVRERVIRSILARYLEQDTHFRPTNGHKIYVPRFLINDFVRYWRTIAVDYAGKIRGRGTKGWALRNLKLRMSRKMIFVAGLLMCFECELHRPKADPAHNDLFAELFSEKKDSILPFIQQLMSFVNRTPLDILAEAVINYAPDSRGLAERLFASYDSFLAKMDDKELRIRLEKLSYDEAKNDRDFNALREVGRQFQDGLVELFFRSDQELCKLTQEYAVF